MKNEKRWKKAQLGEKLFQESRKEQRDTNLWLEKRKSNWKDILKYTNQFINVNEIEPALEIGCGPAGLFLVLKHKKLFCLDPLMRFYLKKFDYLKKFKNVKWVSCAFEDFNEDTKFDITYSFNSMDHVKDINQYMLKLEDSIKKGGYHILGVATYHSRKYQKLMIKHNSILDPDHPYHFSYQDIIKLFKNFELVESKPVDEITKFKNEKKQKYKSSEILKRIRNLFHNPLIPIKLIIYRVYQIKTGKKKLKGSVVYIFRKK